MDMDSPGQRAQTNKRMRRERAWCSLRRENFDIPSPEDQELGAPFTNDREKEK